MFAVRNNTTHKELDLIVCTPNSVDPASRVVKGRAAVTSPEKYWLADVSWGSFQQGWCHWMNANELWWRNIAGGLQTGGCLCDPLTVAQQRAHWCHFAANHIGYSFIKDSVFIVWGGYRYKRENLMNDWGKMKEHNVFCKCSATEQWLWMLFIICTHLRWKKGPQKREAPKGRALWWFHR